MTTAQTNATFGKWCNNIEYSFAGVSASSIPNGEDVKQDVQMDSIAVIRLLMYNF
jgi:hypothetical protein